MGWGLQNPMRKFLVLTLITLKVIFVTEIHTYTYLFRLSVCTQVTLIHPLNCDGIILNKHVVLCLCLYL
jgi:hypothetical protein